MNEVSSISEILVVDDERFSRRVLVRTLENAGFTCRECSGGLEALRLIGEQLPSLLLLDYSMPDDLNGAEVCEHVRAHADSSVAQLPIIMLTGMGGEEQEVFCLQAGANDFVAKPVNPAVLKARIDTQLRLSTLRRQLEGQNQALADWRAELERDLEAARLDAADHHPARPAFGSRLERGRALSASHPGRRRHLRLAALARRQALLLDRGCHGARSQRRAADRVGETALSARGGERRQPGGHPPRRQR